MNKLLISITLSLVITKAFAQKFLDNQHTELKDLEWPEITIPTNFVVILDLFDYENGKLTMKDSFMSYMVDGEHNRLRIDYG